MPDDTKKRFDETKTGLKNGSFSIWKGPIVFYVKGVEGKVPGGDKK